MKKLLFSLTAVTCLFLNLPKSRPFTCDSPRVRAGGAAQNVCLGDKTVLKQARPCGNLDYKCHFKGVKQYYTNRNWFYFLHHRAVTKMINMDPPQFERVDHVDVHPNCVENFQRLSELDDLLGKHGMIMTDVNKHYNVVLNEGGNLTLIDFNLFPVAMQAMIDKYDLNSRPINPFKNIYGFGGMSDWFKCT